MENYLEKATIGFLGCEVIRDTPGKFDILFKEANTHFANIIDEERDNIIGCKNSNVPILNPILGDIEKLLLNNNKDGIELEYKNRGKQFWANIIFSSENEFVLLLKDTTQNVYLNRLKLRYEQLFEQSILPMFLIEPESNTIFEVNASALMLTGYDKEELICTHVSKIIIENKTDADELMDTVQIKSDLRQNNKIIITKSGQKRFFDANYSYFTYDSRELILIGGIDTTDRKIREDELAILNKTKDKFFSIIAHDLRSPLASMFSFANILYENYEEYDMSSQKELIGYMHKSITDMQRLLDNLLTWANSQRGTISFNQEEYNLYHISNSTIEMLSMNAHQKAIKITNDIPPQYTVNIDKEMISAVIRNLISNAIKFSYRKGEITVQAKTHHENAKESVMVSIKDKGVGISEKAALTLFDIGEENSTPGTENEKGTGLGLILCKEFIDKHDGKIWVVSEKGKGSEFHFTLPVK